MNPGRNSENHVKVSAFARLFDAMSPAAREAYARESVDIPAGADLIEHFYLARAIANRG